MLAGTKKCAAIRLPLLLATTICCWRKALECKEHFARSMRDRLSPSIFSTYQHLDLPPPPSFFPLVFVSILFRQAPFMYVHVDVTQQGSSRRRYCHIEGSPTVLCLVSPFQFEKNICLVPRSLLLPPVRTPLLPAPVPLRAAPDGEHLHLPSLLSRAGAWREPPVRDGK